MKIIIKYIDIVPFTGFCFIPDKKRVYTFFENKKNEEIQMKIKILLLDDCISFGPKINQHEYIQATFEELSLEEPFFISLFTNTHLKESLEKFKKRMKLK